LFGTEVGAGEIAVLAEFVLLVVLLGDGLAELDDEVVTEIDEAELELVKVPDEAVAEPVAVESDAEPVPVAPDMVNWGEKL